MGRIVCFDLGWTLEDERGAQAQRIAQTCEFLRRFGRDVEPQEFEFFQDMAGSHGHSSVYDAALDVLTIDAAQRAELRKAVSWDASLCRLYDGAADILEALSRHAELAIIANQSKPITARLQAYGILQYFRQVIVSCEVGVEKPELGIFKKLVHGKADEVWMIGDRVDNDIVPAKSLGWKTVRVKLGSHRDYEARSAAETADYTINNLAGLRDIAPLFA